MKLSTLLLTALLCVAPSLSKAEPIGSISFENNGYTHITTNTTTILTQASLLVQLCINTKGATANLATIYDGSVATGNIIAVVDTTSNVGCMRYSAAITKGIITVVTATGTAGDLTVAWR